LILLDKRALNFLIIITLTFVTVWWTSFIFHLKFEWNFALTIIILRILASILIYKDYSLSWSKSTQKTFLIKTIVVAIPTLISIMIFYGEVRIAFMLSEASFYLVAFTFSMYTYYFYINRSGIPKTKSLVIYGAGKAGNKLKDEFRNSEYRVKYFVDDDVAIQGRSIDGVKVVSKSKLKELMGEAKEYELLVIAIPTAPKERVKNIHETLNNYFKEIKILPTIQEILKDKNYAPMLQNISVEDLLARNPQDLDKKKIESFIKAKTILITGAGGSIGSEIARQCEKFGAKKLILLDNSEYNLYKIAEEITKVEIVCVMQSVINRDAIDATFELHKPQIVIHAAAYKHVPLVEANIDEAIVNNIVGTKNTVDISIKHKVEKFVLISTDKAVRPTNVMGTTKRICELYAQNANAVSLKSSSTDNAKRSSTDIVAVRFGNVLGSSGSVIPKFKSQIEKGQSITVTHPDITRYFMLIPEACELVLQAGAIGSGGEIFILDMGKPIKIVDLAKKMIELSGKKDIEIEFSGLRPGEKLYEELLIDNTDCQTEYESITVARPTVYDIDKLNRDIEELLSSSDKLKKLKEIVPEFDHQLN